MREIAVSDGMTSDKGEWREMTVAPTVSELGKEEAEGEYNKVSVQKLKTILLYVPNILATIEA
jgi:hypothetical protein